MLRKLFKRKPRLDAPDSDDRIAALAALGRDQQATFSRLFRDDPDRAVRLAALERLEEPETLAAALSDGEMADAVAARLLALADDATSPAIRNHPLVLRLALVNAASVEAALQAAERIEDAADRAAALAENPLAEVRLAVAQESWQPHALSELEKATRGRDKAVHRLARERLALLKSATAEREAQDAAVEKTLDAASALADNDVHYDARRNVFERDWAQQIAAIEATDNELARFGVARRDLEVLSRRFPARRQPARSVAATVKIDFAALLADAESLREETEASVAAELDSAAASRFKRSAEELTAQWSASADIKPPGDTSSAAFRESMAAVTVAVKALERALSLAKSSREILDRPLIDVQQAESLSMARHQIHRQQEAIEQLVRRYAWPDALVKPAALTALGNRRRDLDNAAQRCGERQSELVAEISAGVTRLRELVDAGAIAEAVVLERQLRDLGKQLPKEALPDNADLADLGAQVRRLHDWRTYAEASKREDLCEQIEKLAEAPLDVHEQAEAVKSLRQQWNELGPVSSRRERDLRKRFDGAAERAFEFCRVHFKEQAAQRKFNLQQRQAIVAALENFIADNDWDHADWRGVEQVLRQARAEWRKYHPAERRAGRQLSNRFEAMADELHSRLKDAWARNVELKEALVAEARQIGESSAAATDKAEAMKALQRRWKAIGPVPRRVDQRLWKLFRAECDSVFEARNAVHDRHDKRQRAIAETKALIAELEKRVDIDPALDRNTVADYERRLHDFDDLPNELRRQVDAMLEYADRAALERQAINSD